MDKQQEGVLEARLGVIEIMLAWFLADMIKRSSEEAEKTAEGIRAILTEMAPKSSRTRTENSPQMRAFRKEWDRRIDSLFDDAIRLIGQMLQ